MNKVQEAIPYVPFFSPIPPKQEQDDLSEFDAADIFPAEKDENDGASQDFDNMLSGLDLEGPDSLDDIDGLDDDGFDVPKALLSGLGDMVEDARSEDAVNTDDGTDDIFPDFDTDFAIQKPNLDKANKPDIENIADLNDFDLDDFTDEINPLEDAGTSFEPADLGINRGADASDRSDL